MYVRTHAYFSLSGEEGKIGRRSNLITKPQLRYFLARKRGGGGEAAAAKFSPPLLPYYVCNVLMLRR